MDKEKFIELALSIPQEQLEAFVKQLREQLNAQSKKIGLRNLCRRRAWPIAA